MSLDISLMMSPVKYSLDTLICSNVLLWVFNNVFLENKMIARVIRTYLQMKLKNLFFKITQELKDYSSLLCVKLSNYCPYSFD